MSLGGLLITAQIWKKNTQRFQLQKAAYGLDLFEIFVLIPKIPWLNDQLYVSPNIDKGQICWELFLPSNEQATKMDTVNGRIPAPVDGWSFFPLFRRVLYIQTVVVWDFWTITTSHPLMLPERWTPSSPRCFRDGSCSGFFLLSMGIPHFFDIRSFARHWSVMCFFCFTLPKGNLFFGQKLPFFYFLAPQKKPHILMDKILRIRDPSNTIKESCHFPCLFLREFSSIGMNSVLTKCSKIKDTSLQTWIMSSSIFQPSDLRMILNQIWSSGRPIWATQKAHCSLLKFPCSFHSSNLPGTKSSSVLSILEIS